MEDKGFFGSLFDFSFESFVFPKVISFIYGIIVVLMAIGYLGLLVFAFGQGTTEGVAAIILGPVVLILYLIMVRAWMEIAIVMFRIYDNTGKIVEMKKQNL
ncbi:MAG: DUF4282 domain-containing protein [Candidatus Fermentibacteraceae bacterium]|nr:DUF4282 domain-containing protein [Candidatus Fermentibacteraceae bacterium]